MKTWKLEVILFFYYIIRIQMLIVCSIIVGIYSLFMVFNQAFFYSYLDWTIFYLAAVL